MAHGKPVQRDEGMRATAVPVAVVALFAAGASLFVFGDLRLVLAAVGGAAMSELGLWWRRRRVARAGEPDQGT